jgi:hypothetical protein
MGISTFPHWESPSIGIQFLSSSGFKAQKLEKLQNVGKIKESNLTFRMGKN